MDEKTMDEKTMEETTMEETKKPLYDRKLWWFALGMLVLIVGTGILMLIFYYTTTCGINCSLSGYTLLIIGLFSLIAFGFFSLLHHMNCCN